MESLNKRIMSTLLAGALTVGVGAPLQNEAKAAETTTITEADAANMDLVEVCHMKGIYNVIVNNVPVYVYLNNKVDNEYLLKNEAVEIAKKNYNTDKVYFYSKVVESPYYVKGETPEEERYNFVYALSDKTSVKGWTRVKDTKVITDGELVSTTIELGEFILKEVDLTRFTWDFTGFGYADVNHDNIMGELVYVGNNGSNMLLDKASAQVMINEGKGKIKVYEKKLSDRKMYALSSVKPDKTWTQSSMSKINNNTQIGSTTEYMDALYHVASTTVTTEQLYFPKLDLGTTVSDIAPVSNNINTINMLIKDEALSWASKTYAPALTQYCILQKEYIDKNTGFATKVYAISTQLYVDGYDFAFDDQIPANAMICLSVEDAENYVALYGKSVTKALK